MNLTNFYLSGGGVKCAYQAPFIKHLLDTGTELNEIYGTSFGAFVGYFVCLDKYDIIDEFFLTLNKDMLEPCFTLMRSVIANIPLIGNIIKQLWLCYAIKNKGFYLTSYAEQFLNKFLLTPDDITKLKRFYCCVFNVTKGTHQYIRGNHPLIHDYIIASCSLWMAFPPKHIRQLCTECLCNNACENCYDKKKYLEKPELFCNCPTHQYNEFIDGGVLRHIPFEKELHYDKNIMHFVLALDDITSVINGNINISTGDNMFDYLNNLIRFHILTNMHNELKLFHAPIVRYSVLDESPILMSETLDPENLFIIDYCPPTNDPFDTDKNKIKKMINDGIDLAKKIEILTYY